MFFGAGLSVGREVITVRVYYSEGFRGFEGFQKKWFWAIGDSASHFGCEKIDLSFGGRG
jgi:hypothetical protein